MKIKYALTTIKEIILEIERQNVRERLISYSIITSILNELDEIAECNETPNYALYKHELLWSCKSICGLDDGNSHSAKQHTVWALDAVDKLKSVKCFDVFNMKPKVNFLNGDTNTV